MGDSGDRFFRRYNRSHRDTMAGLTLPPPGFDQLSPDEKLEYIEALWEHMTEHPEDVPIEDWHRDVVREGWRRTRAVR